MRKSNRAADCKAQYQRIAFERHPMSPLLRSASITREFTHLQVRHGHSQSHARPSPLPITSSHFARSGGETGFEQIRPHVDWHSEYANAIGPTLRASPPHPRSGPPPPGVESVWNCLLRLVHVAFAAIIVSISPLFLHSNADFGHSSGLAASKPGFPSTRPLKATSNPLSRLTSRLSLVRLVPSGSRLRLQLKLRTLLHPPSSPAEPFGQDLHLQSKPRRLLDLTGRHALKKATASSPSRPSSHHPHLDRGS
ncbi:uncharacterized protein PAN0_005d2735 [Moesziomyces antarcticus]|uniref:Uncharacterized protein n=1 Tax=Pseudozyma antarctica TaxID=84753 RepID=A0A081CCX5_PSEA2|nr:uncharacterized protein PAN0_005d2735 [Moesziomyces antarcticus]GAK64521.1 hypothetical protein PAN0_005d2735 [Moesziomyces antarcticus]